MAFAIDGTRHDSVAGINITPLVDVMLVLLVIFMIAAPVLTQRIHLDLPGAALPIEQPQPPPPIRLRIDAGGQIYWNDNATPASALPAMLEAEYQRAGGGGTAAVLPTLQIDVSDEADYGAVARVLAAANNADWQNLGFVRR